MIITLPSDWDEFFKRMDAVFALQPSCPRCNATQVQIIDWKMRPAQWRCRLCKTYFTAEPDES